MCSVVGSHIVMVIELVCVRPETVFAVAYVGSHNIGAVDNGGQTHYLFGITDAQLALLVRQRTPKKLDEAVSLTLQMESYLVTTPRPDVDIAVTEQGPSKQFQTDAVHLKSREPDSKQADKLVDMLGKLVKRLDDIEAKMANEK